MLAAPIQSGPMCEVLKWVENKVNEVRKFVPAKCWKHCLGIENPADIPSRGITPTKLASSTLWRYGPDWLGERNQVLEEECYGMECFKEMKVTCRYVAHTFRPHSTSTRLFVVEILAALKG